MDAIITQFSPTAAPALNKGQRTASRILDAAEALFAQHGYDATSLRDIAARAGLQQPGLYKHFAGKDDLYRQVYERALKPVTDLMDEMLSAPDHSFAGLTDRMTDLLAHHPNIARLLMRATLSSDVEPDLVALDWVGRLVDYGRTLSKKAGTPSTGSVLAVQIVAIFNMLFGFFWSSPLIERLSGQPATDEFAMDVQKRLLRDFIAGMGEARAMPGA